MFSLRDNASKTGFIWLVKQLQLWHYQLIDCQVPSEHLRSLGAQDMPRTQFLEILAQARSLPGKQGLWEMELSDLASE